MIGSTLGPGGSLAAGLPQPRIAGFANVDTWSYGLGIFNGTSSAAPHVAGAAALVRSAFPNHGPADVQGFLESQSLDSGAAGYDALYGQGRLWLGDASVPLAHVFSDGFESGGSTGWSSTVP